MFKHLAGVTRTQIGVLAIVALLASMGTAGAVTILTSNPNPITAAEGSLSSSSVTIDSQSLTYSGVDVTGSDVVINNTDSSNHTVDLHLALRADDGTIVESTTNASISVEADSTKTVTWTFSSPHAVDTFSKVEVTVEQTG